MLRLALLAMLLAAPALAQPRLTEAAVRAFVDQQRQAWESGDVDAYFATFAPSARFTDQALGSDNKIVPYGTSTREQARAQVRRALAGAQVTEEVQIQRIAVSADGQGATLAASVRTRIVREGRVRTVCARRLASFALVGGRLRGLGRTDTLVRCRAGP